MKTYLSKSSFGIFLAIIIPNAFSSECNQDPYDIDDLHREILWKDDFARNMAGWGEVKFQFGVENIQFIPDPERRFSKLLRVHYPKGSFDPGTALKGLAPMGGVQFTSNFEKMKVPESDEILLSYSVRFEDGFNFVRGGKLPGLYGGIPISGGKISTGYNGYSTRIVWQVDGKGGVYAYLPTNSNKIKDVTYGDVMGAGKWQFKPGKWTDVSHLVKLNDPGMSNGRITIWIDGILIHDECGLEFRKTPTLRINGIFFSTFFGGNDLSWASKNDTYIDFSNFRLYRYLSEGLKDSF